MDINLVTLCGRLATRPLVHYNDSGERFARYLVTTKVETPHKRLDVVPVIQSDPVEDVTTWPPGVRVYVAGRVERHFWQAGDKRRSRIDIVALRVMKEAS